MERDFDLVVVGGGSAGYAAAAAASAEGLTVAVVESAEQMGGLCVNNGCMPSKTLIETANRMRAIREADEFAIRVKSAPEVDMAALQERRARLVDDFAGYRVEQLREGDFTLIRGSAQFLDVHHLQVEGDSPEVIRFETAVIATGSEPFVPEIEGLEGLDFWLSKDALETTVLPERLLVLGAGVIGCELGHCFEGLGSEVVLINRSEHVLSEMPDCVGEIIAQASQERGVEIVTGVSTERVVRDGSQIVVEVSDGEGKLKRLKGSHLLVSTGRKPRIGNLGLENCQVEFDKTGVKVSATGQTSQSHIFAVGDCAHGAQIVHEAVIKGRQAGFNAIRQIRGEALVPADTEPLILAVFSEPEVIHIGPEEPALQERVDELESREFHLPEMGKAIVKGLKHGVLKVTFEREGRKLIAATGVGHGVIDFSHTLVLAIRKGMTLEEFLEVPHYHPTLAEAWTYLKD